jgi:hypothetical protein
MVSELIVTNIVVSGKGIYLMVTIACLNIVTVLQLNHDNFRWFCNLIDGLPSSDHFHLQYGPQACMCYLEISY